VQIATISSTVKSWQTNDVDLEKSMVNILSVTRNVNDRNGNPDEVKTLQLKKEREELIRTLMKTKKVTGKETFGTLGCNNFKIYKEISWKFVAGIAKSDNPWFVGKRLTNVHAFAASAANDAIGEYDNSVPMHALLLPKFGSPTDTAQMRHEAETVFDLR
jgi:hypothetical protein